MKFTVCVFKSITLLIFANFWLNIPSVYGRPQATADASASSTAAPPPAMSAPAPASTAPTAQPAPILAMEATPPAAPPVAQPAAQPAAQSVAQPVAQPAAQPAAQPMASQNLPVASTLQQALPARNPQANTAEPQTPHQHEPKPSKQDYTMPNENFPTEGQPQNQQQSGSPPFTFQIPLPGSDSAGRPNQPQTFQIRFVPLGVLLLERLRASQQAQQNPNYFG